MRIINTQVLLQHAQTAYKAAQTFKSQADSKLQSLVSESKQKFFPKNTAPSEIKYYAKLHTSEIENLSDRELSYISAKKNDISAQISFYRSLPFMTPKQKTKLQHLEQVILRLNTYHEKQTKELLTETKELLALVGAARKAKLDNSSMSKIHSRLQELSKNWVAHLKQGPLPKSEEQNYEEVKTALIALTVGKGIKLTPQQEEAKNLILSKNNDEFLKKFGTTFTVEDAKQIWTEHAIQNLLSEKPPEISTQAMGIKIRTLFKFENDDMLAKNGILSISGKAEIAYLTSYKAKEEKALDLAARHEDARQATNGLTTTIAKMFDSSAETFLESFNTSINEATTMNSTDAKKYLASAGQDYRNLHSAWMKGVRIKAETSTPEQKQKWLQAIKTEFPAYANYPTLDAVLDQMILPAFTETPFDSLLNAIKSKEALQKTDPSNIGGLIL